MTEYENQQPTDFEVTPTAPTTPDQELVSPGPIQADFSEFENFDKPATVIKHQTLMELQSNAGEYAIYEQKQSETGEPVEAISVTGSMFEDLGRPSVITVTVRPGDHLNN